LHIPTIGIGAGPATDAQVLVWQDMAGLRSGKPAKFVKEFAQVGTVLHEAATRFADEVRGGVYPGEEHSYS
jgi:3-methyl-2-oxobutanoate hydroxymethyltransferase